MAPRRRVRLGVGAWRLSELCVSSTREPNNFSPLARWSAFSRTGFGEDVEEVSDAVTTAEHFDTA